MPPVILPYTYILHDWRVEKRTHLEKVSVGSPPMTRHHVTVVVLVITNPAPVDLSFHIALFDEDGNEQIRPPRPRPGGILAPDAGFPMSGRIGPRNQIRLLLDNALDSTLSLPEIYVSGWARVATSHPAAIHAHIQSDSGMGEVLPITLLEPVISTSPTTGNPTPPPPRSAPPPPPFVLEELPRMLSPKELMVGAAGRFLTGRLPVQDTANAVIPPRSGWLRWVLRLFGRESSAR